MKGFPVCSVGPNTAIDFILPEWGIRRAAWAERDAAALRELAWAQKTARKRGALRSHHQDLSVVCRGARRRLSQ